MACQIANSRIVGKAKVIQVGTERISIDESASVELFEGLSPFGRKTRYVQWLFGVTLYPIPRNCAPASLPKLFPRRR
jgi:hypothetical protein